MKPPLIFVLGHGTITGARPPKVALQLNDSRMKNRLGLMQKLLNRHLLPCSD